MADYVLLDEYHISIRVPKDLDDDACDAIRQILDSRTFRKALRRAVRQIVHTYPELTTVEVRISV